MCCVLSLVRYLGRLEICVFMLAGVCAELCAHFCFWLCSAGAPEVLDEQQLSVLTQNESPGLKHPAITEKAGNQTFFVPTSDAGLTFSFFK